MTSNLGAHLLQKELTNLKEEELPQAMKRIQPAVMQLIQKKFPSELLNRIDETILFNPLPPSVIYEIVQIKLRELQDTLRKEKVDLTFTNAYKAYLAEVGYDPVYGARPLQHAIQKTLLNPLSHALIAGKVKRGSPIYVDRGKEETLINLAHKESGK